MDRPADDLCRQSPGHQRKPHVIPREDVHQDSHGSRPRRKDSRQKVSIKFDSTFYNNFLCIIEKMMVKKCKPKLYVTWIISFYMPVI